MASRQVHCPTCNRPVEWSAASPFRPFCSDRCRLIDLGAWVSEQRGIGGEETLPGDAESTEPSELDPDHRQRGSAPQH